jgi:hypothetical protein
MDKANTTTTGLVVQQILQNHSMGRNRLNYSSVFLLLPAFRLLHVVYIKESRRACDDALVSAKDTTIE